MSISDLIVQQMVVRKAMRDSHFEPGQSEEHGTSRVALTSPVTRMRSGLAAILIAAGERLRPQRAITPCDEAMNP